MTSIDLITKLTTDVKAIIATTETELATLSEETLNKQESPDRWSIMQCLEHLNRYSRYYHPWFNKALQVKSPGLQEVKSTWLGRTFIRMMHPSNVKPQKTFARMNPIASTLDYSVVDEFLHHQRELLSILDQARNAALNSKTVPVEFFKLLRLSLAEALQFVIVHQQRHIAQALRAKAAINAHPQPAEPALKV